MSILIDKFIQKNQNDMKEHNGKWYICKPLTYFLVGDIIPRIKDAVRVLTGKSFACHYYEDEK